jgi:hypothetical protein
MFTVAQKATPRKVFRATLRDEAGVLAKVDGTITFFTDAGEVIEVEPEDCVWLCILGEMGISETQALMDKMSGGYAKVACSRAQEVA